MPCLLLSACSHQQPQLQAPTAAAPSPAILDGIATCIRDGSFKGEGVTVTGYTDPRGSDSYNQDLRKRRADTTRDYLMSKGVASTDITVQSRGKQDATGDEATGWQLDRRVEIDEGNAVASQ
jgi:outer membrane protein OmpA-like peptidoglycan-associated protein